MQKFVDNLHVLGLRKKEIAVYSTLTIFGTLNVTKLAARARLSRTTVGVILKRLQGRGFVREVRIGGHNEWKANDLSKVRGRANAAFDEIRAQLAPGMLGAVLESIDAENVGIRVFRGKKQVYEAFQYVASKPHRHMCGIQGAQFANDYLNHVFERQNEMAAHATLAKNDVLTEGITTSEALAFCEQLDVEYLKNTFSRPMVLYKVPSKLVDIAGEIIIFENSAIFSLPKDTLMVLIEHPLVVQILRSFFDLLKMMGNRVDTYELLQSLLDKKR